MLLFWPVSGTIGGAMISIAGGWDKWRVKASKPAIVVHTWYLVGGYLCCRGEGDRIRDFRVRCLV